MHPDMSKSIAVPEDLYNRAVELAARDHEFVSGLLANRLASREYIEARAKLFNSARRYLLIRFWI